MLEEPETPRERARFIVARIDAAMRDFAETHPRLPARPARRSDPSRLGVWTPGSFEASGPGKLRVVPGHYEPAPEADWSLDGPRQRRTTSALSDALAAYVEGEESLDGVKAHYREFAASHLAYRFDGRLFYDERAARLAVAEKLNEHFRVFAQAIDPAPLAHPAGRGEGEKRGPRLAYSRRGD